MYSIDNEGKSVVPERCIKTLKNKIYKYMIAVPKNVYFDVLDDTGDKCNNIQHAAIKKKPNDIKSNSHAEYNVDSSDKYPKFKVGDHVRISRYKKTFAKGYTQARNQRGGDGGELSPTLFQNLKKNALILGKKMPQLGSSMGLTSHLKCCFKRI